MHNQDRNINYFLEKAASHILSKKYKWINSVDLESHSEVKNEAYVFILETTLNQFKENIVSNKKIDEDFDSKNGLMIIETDISNYVNAENFDFQSLINDLEEIKKISRVDFLFKFAVWIAPTEVES